MRQNAVAPRPPQRNELISPRFQWAFFVQPGKGNDRVVAKYSRADHGYRQSLLRRWTRSEGSIEPEKVSARLRCVGNSSGNETDGSVTARFMPVNWQEAQQKAARTARWAVTMTKVRIRRVVSRTRWQLVTETTGRPRASEKRDFSTIRAASTTDLIGRAGTGACRVTAFAIELFDCQFQKRFRQATDS